MNKEKITEIKKDGKTQGWYGSKIPETAQEILDEVEKELEEKYKFPKELKGGIKKDDR
jgi:uncharacterized alkaline shock family protein YloU